MVLDRPTVRFFMFNKVIRKTHSDNGVMIL